MRNIYIEEIEGTDRMDYARRPIALATRTIPSDEGEILVVQMAGCGRSERACLFIEPESSESIEGTRLGKSLSDGTYGGIVHLSDRIFSLAEERLLIVAFDYAEEVFATFYSDEYTGEDDSPEEPESKLLGTRFYARPMTEEERGEFIILMLGTDCHTPYTFWEG